MDRWGTYPVVCKGGLDLYTDVVTKGTTLPGVATILQNFEPSVEGGYQRISGYTKWDSAVVPGDTNNPVLGVKVALGGVFAVRKTAGGDNALYYSTGSGWGSALNSATRTGSVSKARITSYSITEPVIVTTDGVNPALKYNGTTDTLINGTGAPADPKYATEHLNRLVLAGYSATPFAISLSAPNADTDFTGANGAVELAVGDTVTGLASFRGTLYIFCENSIHKLTGLTSSEFAIEEVTDSIGCISHDSIQEVGGDIVFLAPDGLRSVAGTERIGDIEFGLLSKAIQPLVRPQIGTLTENDFCSCVVRKKSQYRVFLNDGTLSRLNQKGFLGRLEAKSTEGTAYSWATTLGFSAYSSDSEYIDDDEFVVFGDISNGYVYRQEVGNSFDGENISHVYRTPALFFDDQEKRKVLFKVRIYTQAEGDFETTLTLNYDPGDEDVRNPAPFSLAVTTDGAKYGAAVYGTDKYSSITNPTLQQRLLGSGRSCAFQFSQSNTAEAFRIDSFIIQYSVKGKR